MSKRLIAISDTTIICVCSATIVGIKIMIDKITHAFNSEINQNSVEVYITSSMSIDLGEYNKTCNIIRTSDSRAVIEFKGHVIKCKRVI